MKAKLGAHFPYLKDLQLYGVVSDAIEMGANSGSFYISNPKSYAKIEQDVDSAKYAQKLAEKNGIEIEDFIVRAPIIGNLAEPIEKSNVFSKTYASYLSDLKQMGKAGLKYFAFFPGSSKDPKEAVKNIADAINDLHMDTYGEETVILLELMTTHGHDVIGTSLEELKDIIYLVNDKDRVGICIDTCHAWDAGYDIRDNLDGFLEEFEEKVGMPYLKALHISDSKNDIGSQKGMHEQVGLGKIGERALRNIVNHPKLANLPKSLETSTGVKDFTKYKDEFERLVDE